MCLFLFVFTATKRSKFVVGLQSYYAGFFFFFEHTGIIWRFLFFTYTASWSATSGFQNLSVVQNQTTDITTVVGIRQWIFPSMIFTCAGRITKWIFRASPLMSTDSPLVLFEVWRENTTTSLNTDDYVLVTTSGSREELVGEGPVYEYILQSPIEVQQNYTFGISHPNMGEEDLRILYLNLEMGQAPTSYFRAVEGTVFDLSVEGSPVDQFIPLVTAEISKSLIDLAVV